MTRKEETRKASIAYQMSVKPQALGGDAFADLIEAMNVNSSFIAGAEWADANPNEQAIAKYLYKKKGYPIDLNGNIPSFEDTMKDVEKYNNYKKKQFIEKTCKWLKSKGSFVIGFYRATIKDFRNYMNNK